MNKYFLDNQNSKSYTIEEIAYQAVIHRQTKIRIENTSEWVSAAKIKELEPFLEHKKRYFLNMDSKQYSKESLKSLEIAADTKVRIKGLDEWVNADTIVELADLIEYTKKYYLRNGDTPCTIEDLVNHEDVSPETNVRAYGHKEYQYAEEFPELSEALGFNASYKEVRKANKEHNRAVVDFGFRIINFIISKEGIIFNVASLSLNLMISYLLYEKTEVVPLLIRNQVIILFLGIVYFFLEYLVFKFNILQRYYKLVKVVKTNYKGKKKTHYLICYASSFTKDITKLDTTKLKWKNGVRAGDSIHFKSHARERFDSYTKEKKESDKVLVTARKANHSPKIKEIIIENSSIARAILKEVGNTFLGSYLILGSIGLFYVSYLTIGYYVHFSYDMQLDEVSIPPSIKEIIKFFFIALAVISILAIVIIKTTHTTYKRVIKRTTKRGIYIYTYYWIQTITTRKSLSEVQKNTTKWKDQYVNHNSDSILSDFNGQVETFEVTEDTLD